MRPSGDLRRLYGAFARRLMVLKWCAHRAGGGQGEAAIAFAVIELQSTWANFIRSYYLSSAYGARTGRGIRIRLGVGVLSSESDAIGLAIRVRRPTAVPKSDGSWHRRDEPKWYESATMLALFKHLRISNLAVVDAAYSLQSTTLLDVPVVRNFFAHRNWQTEVAARAVGRRNGISGSLRPVQILDAPRKSSQLTLMDEWFQYFDVMADLLTE